MAKKPQNNHYVPSFLTRDWSINGQLTYYDFGSKALKTGTNKTLFAGKGIYSDLVEEFLNKNVETPLGKFKHTHAGAVKAKNILDPKIYRALYLYFITQPARFATVFKKGLGLSIEELAKKSTSELACIVNAFKNFYDLKLALLPNQQVVFMPECGFFKMPIVDNRNANAYGDCIACPLTPTKVFALFPKDIPQDVLDQQKFVFMAHSVCPNETISRVVIPKAISDSLGENEIIEKIESYRKDAKRSFDLLNQLHDILNRILKKLFSLV